MSWRIEALNRSHGRTDFSCGEAALDEFLRKFALQNAQRGLGKTFVLSDDGVKVYGFYTLSAAAAGFEDIPENIKVGAKYPVPVARLSRLAVDSREQGRGFGAVLLFDVIQRCAKVSTEMGVFGVVVDAKHEQAKQFYLKHGFVALTNKPLTLFMPLATARKLWQIP